MESQSTRKQLRQTIGQLEAVIQELDGINVRQLPESSSLKTLVQTTQELENTINQVKQTASYPIQTPTTEVTTVINSSESQTIQLPQENTISENSVISKTNQSLLSQSRKWLVLGIVVAIAIFLVQIGLSFLPVQSLARAEVVTTTDSEQPVIIKESEPTPEADSPTNQQIVESTPVETEETLIPEEIILTETGAEAATEIIIPAIQFPEKSKKIRLTPEQEFIAAIKKQIAKISTSYEPDLLTTIEANFNQNKLSITLDDQWYELNSDRQNTISQEILKRSRQLAFAKLILQDKEGKLIARSPVIGNDLVILERTN